MQRFRLTELLYGHQMDVVGCSRLHGLMNIRENSIDVKNSASLQFPASLRLLMALLLLKIQCQWIETAELDNRFW